MKRLASFFLLLMMLLSLAACGGSKDHSNAEYGGVGDTMSTAWFDFTVTDAYSCAQYQGYLPSEGYKLVVVALSLKNDCGRPADMRGDDFVICWGDDDDIFSEDIPLAAGLSGDQFPDEYILDANESKTGVMVFEVPQEFHEFTVRFMEPFASDFDADPDSDEGETFFVDFTAEDRE